MDGAAETPVPDLGLDRLRASLPDLYIGPGDYIRIHSYFTGLIDQGWRPAGFAEFGPHMSMLLARDEAEERAIRAFYADDDTPADEPLAEAISVPLAAAEEQKKVLIGRRRFWIAFLIGLFLAVVATFVVWQMGALDIVAPVDPETAKTIDEAEQRTGDEAVPDVAENVAEAVAVAVTSQGLLRGVMALLPLILAGWLMYRAAARQAVIDPEASRDLQEAEKKPLPGPDFTGLLSGPALTSSMGLLRLRREQESRRVDPERTATAAAQTAGRALSLLYQSESHSVAHLVLIDRRHQTDHLGVLGDLVLDRLKEAGVEAQAYDLLADPTLLVRCRTAVSGTVPLRSAAALSDEHRGDVVLFVAEAGRLLDRFGRRLAPWAEAYGSPRMLALMTPRPRAHWGREERRLIALGVAVFPVSAEGFRDYVSYRVASISERPKEVPEPSGEVPALLLSEAAEAVREAGGAPEEREDAVFGLQSALSPGAFSLLSVLCIFPTLLPELTLRMRRLMFDRPVGATDIVAELSALPWFREGRLPFWLRVELVSGLSPVRADQARQVIEAFQSDIGDNLEAERTLALARPSDRLRQFLGAFGPRAAHEITSDAIFTRFMRAEDVSDLNVRAKGQMSEDLRRQVRFELAVYATLGLVLAFAVWFVAPAALRVFQQVLVWTGDTFATQIAFVNSGSNRFYAMLAVFLLIAIADRSLPRWPRLRPGRLPAVALSLVVLVGDLAAGVRGASTPGLGADDLLASKLVMGLFLLIISARRRRETPFDPVLFVRNRRMTQLLAGAFLVAAVNFFIAVVLVNFSTSSVLLSIQLVFALALVALVLSVHVLTPTGIPLRARTGFVADALTTLLPVVLILAVCVYLLLEDLLPYWDDEEIYDFFFIGLILLLPVLHQARLITLRHWLVVLAAFSALFAGYVSLNPFGESLLGQLVPEDLALRGMIALFPAAVTATVSVLLLWRYLSRRVVATRMAVFCLTILLSSFVYQQVYDTLFVPQPVVPPVEAPEPFPTPQSDLSEQSAAIGQDVTEETDPDKGPLPEPMVEVPVVVEEAYATDSAYFATVPMITIALFVFFAQINWMRHEAVADTPWPTGSVYALYLAPFAVLPGLHFNLTETLSVSLAGFAPLLAVLLAYRFGYWGLAAFVLGGLSWCVDLSLYSDFVRWRPAPDLLLVSVIIARVVAEPGLLTRILAKDTIRVGQYVLLGLILLMPEVSYNFAGSTIDQVNVRYDRLFLLGGFLVGLTAIPLGIPVIFVLLLAGLRLVISTFVGFPDDPSLHYSTTLAWQMLLVPVMMIAGRGLHNLALYQEVLPSPRLRSIDNFFDLGDIFAPVIWVPNILIFVILLDLFDPILPTAFISSGNFLAMIAAFLLGVRDYEDDAFRIWKPLGITFGVILLAIYQPSLPIFEALVTVSPSVFFRFNLADLVVPALVYWSARIMMERSMAMRLPVLRDTRLWVPFKDKYDDSFPAL